MGGIGASEVQDSYSPPSLFWIFNNLLVLVTALDLIPKPLHPKLRTGYLNYVVKDDQPAGLYQGRIHLEILLNPVVGMVSINKEQVELGSPQSLFNSQLGLGLV